MIKLKIPNQRILNLYFQMKNLTRCPEDNGYGMRYFVNGFISMTEPAVSYKTLRYAEL